MTVCEARQFNDEMSCGRCGLSWDVADADPPKCARTIDRRAIPGRGITTDLSRRDASQPLAPDELRLRMPPIERRRPATAPPIKPDAWVDDLGRVKYRLGVKPFPGMKLYLGPPEPLHAGPARCELVAIEGGEAMRGVYVRVVREGVPDRVVLFKPEPTA